MYQCVTVNKTRISTSLHFRSVCEEDLDKVLNDYYIYAETIIRLFTFDFYMYV